MIISRIVPALLFSLPLLSVGCAEAVDPASPHASSAVQSLRADEAPSALSAALDDLNATPRSTADLAGDISSPAHTALTLAEVARAPRDVEFGAVGMMVVQREGQIVVDNVMPGMPAELAGLSAGTRVLEVDGMSTEGMSLQQFVSLVRGEEATAVQLTVVERGSADSAAVEHTLIRETLATTETRCDRVRRVRHETEFGGVGIQMRSVEGSLRVNGLIEGMPAAEAGVREGDTIVGVDGLKLEGAQMVDVIAAIRGEVGAPVVLDLIGADGEQRSLQVTRSLMVLPEGGMCAGR